MGLCAPQTYESRPGTWCPDGQAIIEADICHAAAQMLKYSFKKEVIKADAGAPQGCVRMVGKKQYILNENPKITHAGNTKVVEVCDKRAMMAAIAAAKGSEPEAEPESEPEPEADGDSDGEPEPESESEPESDGDGDGGTSH